MRLEYATRFDKSLRRLPPHDRQRAADTLEQIVRYCETRQATSGLGLTKLFSSEELGAVFEVRISRALRLLFTVKQDAVTFVTVGNHDEVRRFIRTFQ